MEKNLPAFRFTGFSGVPRWSKAWYLVCSLLFLTVFAPILTHAQTTPLTPQYFKSAGSGNNVYPFNTNTVKRSQHLYLPGDLPGAIAGNILRIYFRSASNGTPGTYVDFKVRMGQTTATTFPGAGATDFFTNLTTVISSASYSLPATTIDAWVPLDLQIPYLYNPGQTLIVEVEMASGTGGFGIRTTSVSAAPNHKRLTANDLVTTTGNASTVWSDFGIDVGPSTPCSGAPTAGSAVSSAPQVCPNNNFQLSLTGNTFASGITYQWQSSPNGTTGWTNITGATSPNHTLSQTSTNHYRAVLTCGSQSSNSLPVQVITTATPVSGVYTINKNFPNSSTNFSSFAAAVAFFECGGLNGPITFNVVANSGPYNEKVNIPVIPGSSATNTITFNGNGNSVISPVASGDVWSLNGADYVRVNNLNIQASPSATAGTVVSLTNSANNNIFNGCTLTHNIGTTSTSQVVYVYTGSSNNTFQNNTLNGAYYGIYNYGASALLNTNNSFIGNTIKDMYYYGIYNYYSTGTLIEGNDISRPNRTATTTTFYGMYISTGSTGLTISKNRIHNTHDASTSAGTVYGIYTLVAGTAGSENIIKNNAIYNINNTGGTLYALYNTGGNNTYYYHNTVSADMPGVSYATLRGMYFVSASTNVKFMNNNISLSNTATTKHAIYVASSTIALTSNGNNLYAPNGNVGYFSTNQATLANWRTASSQDANSVSVDPQYTNLTTGNLTPMNAAMNNVGVALTPPVSDDINGLARNPNAPDAGAFEFMNNSIDVGVTAILTPNSVCGLSNQETISVTVTNFGTTAVSNIPLILSINNAVLGTESLAGPLAPGTSATYTFTIKGNLSATGGYTIQVCTNLTGDQVASNNCTTKLVTNSAFTSLPQLNFETPATGLATVQAVTNSRSAVSENVAASLPLAGQPTTSTKGLVMEGIDNPNWLIPVGITDPWMNNMDNFAAIKLCFNPAGGNPNDPLWLSFDLKQLFKTANANTNFRVTVNGAQIGPTYRPPFSGTPIDWQKVYVDLTPYKGLPSIELALESNVKEAYANGSGTANLVDNIRIVRYNPTGTKENILAASVNIFPNPSNGIFKISLPTGKVFEMEVTDLTGKVISTQTVKGNTANVDLKATAKGIYVLKITSEGVTATKKLVVQ